jgi:hypothetical protein
MRESQWIKWTRTRLQPQEREELLAALTSEQKAHLLEHDYVWAEGIGVLWNPRTASCCGAPGSHTEPTSRRSVGTSTSTPRAARVSSRITEPTIPRQRRDRRAFSLETR